jgi:hypothetical protein
VLKSATPEPELWTAIFVSFSCYDQCAFLCTWCTQTRTGNAVHIIIRMFINSTLCVSNLMLPVCSPNFAAVACTASKVERACCNTCSECQHIRTNSTQQNVLSSLSWSKTFTALMFTIVSTCAYQHLSTIRSISYYLFLSNWETTRFSRTLLHWIR